MFGFLIKKTFFDIWDNLFKVALINIGFIASVAIPVFIPGLLLSVPPLSIAVLLIGILWCSVYLSAAAMVLKRVSDYSSFGFGDFFQGLKESWPAGILIGGAIFVVYFLTTLIIPFYLEIPSMFGLLLAAVIFWTMAVGIVSLQFFFPIRARLDANLLKAFKKCFIIFFDNPGFCIFSLIHNLIILAISGFLAFLFPGPAGALLFLDEALRLRLLKYDWLEENAQDPALAGDKPRRPKIPWDALLIDERERTGTRSLKSFIFPWKD
ncbi:hypothetical protein AGMMS49579_08740 [Spirochaetia bacterium]|nr:hypothetical protein AGMMS49579_08740 [Spirochaetia bacterium]